MASGRGGALWCVGPFYRYRTHLDWLQQPDSQAIPSWRPLLARARLVPVYGLLFLGAARLFPLEYVRSEAFAARALPFRLFYMVPVFFYDYETIKNIDPYGTDFCVRVRDGMRYWNMSVQWWLAQYIYKSSPFRSYVMRWGARGAMRGRP
ncbi:aspartate aminotransferase [Platysternon megacephalum]|uniref:Leukocyte receptor cluster member 4 n=1 Tax=Platysternon megacephalum TaxID=55544 RepID=A0A4D9DKZ8_9SAUR|nr:aspartate aminotransferase [Platysternon megacephalum]